MKNSQKGFAPIIVLILAIAVLAIGGGTYIALHKQKLATQISNSTASFDIASLGVKFELSNTLSDLTYIVINLGGEQAVNSVGFSSKQLEAIGCPASSAPLGYLTYDDNKGGTLVARARNSDLYFIKPDKLCNADERLRDWHTLQNNLSSLVTDYVSESVTSSRTTQTTPAQAQSNPPTAAQAQNTAISVAGMSKHADSNFGFSFYYPSSWTVQNSAARSSYAGGDVQKTLTITPPNGTTGDAVTIDEFYSPTREITIPYDLCSPMSGSSVPAHRYYFDANTHTWMIEVPAYTGISGRDGSQHSVPASTKAADVSQNTMGGLHMLAAGCSGAVIPLSAKNFVVFTFYRNVGHYYTSIAKTIMAADPSVATLVSRDEQIQTIINAGVLLGAIGTKVGQWRVTSEHVYTWTGDIVAGANPSTFKLIDTYSDGTAGASYATDGVHVYSGWSAETPALSGADPATFIAIRQQYQVPYAPSSGRYGESFISYDNSFAKDNSHVWYQGKLIPDANSSTFVVTGNTYIENAAGGYTLAHDSNHTYGIDQHSKLTIDGITIQ